MKPRIRILFNSPWDTEAGSTISGFCYEGIIHLPSPDRFTESGNLVFSFYRGCIPIVFYITLFHVENTARVVDDILNENLTRKRVKP